ncbi:MAG: ParB/RepB/Spo0J family partition protein [Spirochaetes bacterium]|nr:ParB/RepB/Spo0J family partition protein [Spirochaetota bacterium]
MAKKRLGKGIDALIQSQDDEAAPEHIEGLTQVPLDKLRPNPDQPRKHFSEEAIEELAASIRAKGVLQPLLVEESGDGNYLIIAGERRYRAALKAGIQTVPILPRSFTSTEKLEIALIENLQREDLNPIEEARAYQSLMETANATQDELSKRLGKNRSTIANALRLLRLPVSVQEAVAAGRLSPGHARAVLSVENADGRANLAEALLSQDVSVRVAERAAALVNAGSSPEEALHRAAAGAGDSVGEGAGATGEGVRGEGRGARAGAGGSGGSGKDPQLAAIEQDLLERLGTRVTLRGSGERGKIEIEYLSTSDLNRILDLIGGAAGDAAGGGHESGADSTGPG